MTDDPALAIAVPLIAGFEGFSPIPYRDAGAGVYTIGFGFTFLPDGVTPVSATTPYMTRPQGEALLTPLVAKTLAVVREMAVRPLTTHQAAALTSFAYNEGTGNLRRSTLLALFEKGDVAGAADAFLDWTLAGGKYLQGLHDRRVQERVVFLTPDGASTT